MLQDNSTDEQIAAQVIGIPEMFGFLVDRYEKKLDRYIYRKTGLNHDERKDILQDVFVKAYENIASFNTQMSFNAWIYRVCHNTIINDWKKNKRYREGVSFDGDSRLWLESLFIQDLTEHDLDQQILEDHLSDALTHLSDKYRTIIELYYLEGLSYQEISHTLQVPAGTVATQLNRGRIKLGKLLAQYK